MPHSRYILLSHNFQQTLIFRLISSSKEFTATCTNNNADGGGKCVFPFTFENKEYKECTWDWAFHEKRENIGRPWCGTKRNADYDWGDCGDGCPIPGRKHFLIKISTADDQTVCLTSFLTEKPSTCTMTDGRTCVFPFTYDTREYHECLWRNNSAWCGTNYDDAWGHCGKGCPIQGRK